MVDNSEAVNFEESCEDYLAKHSIRQTLERLGVHAVEKALSSGGAETTTSIHMALLACFEDESFMAAEALQQASVPVTFSSDSMISQGPVQMAADQQMISSEMPPTGNNPPPSSNNSAGPCLRRSGCACRSGPGALLFFLYRNLAPGSLLHYRFAHSGSDLTVSGDLAVRPRMVRLFLSANRLD